MRVVAVVVAAFESAAVAVAVEEQGMTHIAAAGLAIRVDRFAHATDN